MDTKHRAGSSYSAVILLMFSPTRYRIALYLNWGGHLLAQLVPLYNEIPYGSHTSLQKFDLTRSDVVESQLVRNLAVTASPRLAAICRQQLSFFSSARSFDPRYLDPGELQSPQYFLLFDTSNSMLHVMNCLDRRNCAWQ